MGGWVPLHSGGPTIATTTAHTGPGAALGASGALEALESLIQQRRTSLRVDPDRPVPAALVERLVRLVTWAPNHKRTFPWRFTLVTGAGRRHLGDAIAAADLRAGRDPIKAERSRTKYLRSPLVLLVGAELQNDRLRRVEDRDAVCAGIQNLLLGATAAGLASHWATGLWMEDPDVKALAGLSAVDEIVALVYLGWPIGDVPVVERPDPVVRIVDH